MTEPEKFIHDFFQQTGYRPEAMPSGREGTPAPPYKTYPGAPVVMLAAPSGEQASQLFEAIASRRSVRVFSEAPITLSQLSQLAWAAQGVTLQHDDTALRAAPSAGGLYPVETYIAVNRADGIAPGLYHLNVADFTLEQLKTNAVGAALADACLGQKFVATAAAVFIWTAVYKRVMWRYGKRGLRYIFMDAGHIGENLHLAGTALGLGCCAVGAFYDDEVAGVLGLVGKDEFPVYLSAVGVPRGTR
jgi:SagB-type dehydrogenase family enzyme